MITSVLSTECTEHEDLQDDGALVCDMSFDKRSNDAPILLTLVPGREDRLRAGFQEA